MRSFSCDARRPGIALRGFTYLGVISQGNQDHGHRRRKQRSSGCQDRFGLAARIEIRYEFHAENFLGMVRLGCIKIMLRYL